MSKPPSSKKGWLKETVEWAVDIYIEVRPSRLARASGLVVLAGITLLIAHFNEYLFRLFLEPIGFKTDSNVAPIIAIILIVIGLGFLFLERIVPTISPPAASDVNLMRKLVEIGDWDYHDYILNRIHNHGYSGDDIKPLWSINHLLGRPDSFFEDEKANNKLTSYKEALQNLAQTTTQYFAPQAGRKEIYYVMLEYIHPDRTGLDNPKFLVAERKLSAAVSDFDDAAKELFAIAKSKELMLVK